MINESSIIRGEKFENLANNDTIYYCHTHESNDFFKSCPDNDFVLITHNSDGNITLNPTRFNLGSSNDTDFNNIQLPKNLIKWFSTNVDVEHDKIESIPIGLENRFWFPEMKKEEKIIKFHNGGHNLIKDKLLYINHNVANNGPERAEPYELFSNVNWATVEHGRNGINFDNYLHNICNHKFVLCPAGNGIDTHRTWEVLYVGSIPIEKRNRNNRFYVDLPICFVDSWSDITEDFLNREYERITSINWNLEKLDFNYWQKRINNLL